MFEDSIGGQTLLKVLEMLTLEMPASKIAEELGIHVRTVERGINLLRKNGFNIEYVNVANRRRMGFYQIKAIPSWMYKLISERGEYEWVKT
ncbi:MAG: hypothetical protein PWP70_1160 [Moorella sp. (in: firmicutes)]|nr:hypothetical protein [Moorella sp. (in: firmicutes)]